MTPPRTRSLLKPLAPVVAGLASGAVAAAAFASFVASPDVPVTSSATEPRVQLVPVASVRDAPSSAALG